jgi:Holliday junction resolvase RusA-like endonuclease
VIELTIPGPPTPKGRPRTRAFAIKPGKQPVKPGRRQRTVGATIYTPTTTKTAEARIAALWDAAVSGFDPDELAALVLARAVRVDVLAVAPRPQRLRRRCDPPGLLWRPAKPDADNVRKLALDALQGRPFARDQIVVAGDTLSAYAERDGVPRTVLRFWPIRVVEVAEVWARLAEVGSLGVVDEWCES